MFSGVIKKMISIHDDPIRYMLDFENDLLFLNQFIGKNISLKRQVIVVYHALKILKFLQMVFVKNAFLSLQCLVNG